MSDIIIAHVRNGAKGETLPGNQVAKPSSIETAFPLLRKLTSKPGSGNLAVFEDGKFVPRPPRADAQGIPTGVPATA
jgi:hypothetical protein